MRILFGVQGTGNGHISRSRTLARALKSRGVAVDYLFSGRAADGYFEMGSSGIIAPSPVSLSPAIRGASRAGVPSRDSPPAFLARSAYPRLSRVRSGHQRLRAAQCPCCSPLGQTPSPSAIRRASTGPFRAGESGFNRQLMRHFAPVRQSLGLHWFHFGQPLLPPIVDPLEPVPDNQQILVYLPFEQTETIAALLSRFSPQSFICFHPEVRKRSEWRNIRFEPPGQRGSSWRWPVVAGHQQCGIRACRRRSPWARSCWSNPGGPVRAVDQRQDPGTDGAGPVDGQPGCQCGAKLAGALLLAEYAIPMWQESWPTGLAGAGEEVGRSPAASGAGLSFRRRCVTAWGACQPYRPGASWLSQLSAFDQTESIPPRRGTDTMRFTNENGDTMTLADNLYPTA